MSSERHVLLWLMLLTLLAATLYLLSGALLPFVAGMGVAYLLDPVADRLERLGLPRTAAALVIIFGFLLLVAMVMVVLVPVLSDQVAGLIARAPRYIDDLRSEVQPLLRRLRSNLTPSQAAQIDEAIKSHAGDVLGWVGQILSSIVYGGAAVLNLLGLLFVMPVVAFYMIRDWDRLVAHIDSLLPLHSADTIRHLAAEIDARLSGFVRGQAIVCLLLGAWYAIGLTIVGLDFALLLGIGAGVLTIIPYLGNIVGLTACLLLAMAQFDNWLSVLLVAAVFLSGQMLEGNFVSPKIVGDRVGLHPVWLMFAVTAGAVLLGITGALLAVPVAAAVGVLVRYGVQRYRNSALYADPRLTDPNVVEVLPPNPPPLAADAGNADGEAAAPKRPHADGDDRTSAAQQ
ncbi:MAG: AI-2E family transporter [Rhodospirillales bacterium]|nr:AI-2E family transporter [Rhodospirillales bacterium]